MYPFKHLLSAVVVAAMLLVLGSTSFRHVEFASAAGPSGVDMPVGNLIDFTQTLADDFTQTVPLGSVSDSGIANWPYAYNYPDTSGRNGTNSTWSSAETISVGGGMLDYYLHTNTAGTAVSGAIGRNASQTYGRYSVRMRADTISGYKTAFLLWPDSENWPTDGEIDFPEGDLSSTVGGSTHYQGGTSGSDQDVWDGLATDTYGSWHTYTIEWTPSALRYYIDSRQVHVTTQRIPNTPMHWVLQSEAWIGEGQPPATSSGHVQIDWATEYSYTPGAVGTATATPPATLVPTATATTTAPTPTAPATSPTYTTLRVNAGATTTYTDQNGQVWQSDQGYVGGTADNTTTATISNTGGAPNVYKTERWGTFSYGFSVPAGTYSVTLKFVECCYNSANSRVFNFSVDGQQVNNFDIRALAGATAKGYDRTFTVTKTSDGMITINFTPISGKDQPEVAGVVIQQTATGGTVPTSTPTPTSVPTATATSLPPTSTPTPYSVVIPCTTYTGTDNNNGSTTIKCTN